MIRRLGAYLPLAMVAAMLLVFGLLADEVVEGDTLGFDRTILLWFRSPGNVAVPIGPLWLQEAVRDVTSLGSFSILGLITILAASACVERQSKPGDLCRRCRCQRHHRQQCSEGAL